MYIVYIEKKMGRKCIFLFPSDLRVMKTFFHNSTFVNVIIRAESVVEWVTLANVRYLRHNVAYIIKSLFPSVMGHRFYILQCEHNHVLRNPCLSLSAF